MAGGLVAVACPLLGAPCMGQEEVGVELMRDEDREWPPPPEVGRRGAASALLLVARPKRARPCQAPREVPGDEAPQGTTHRAPRGPACRHPRPPQCRPC